MDKPRKWWKAAKSAGRSPRDPTTQNQGSSMCRAVCFRQMPDCGVCGESVPPEYAEACETWALPALCSLSCMSLGAELLAVEMRQTLREMPKA